MAAVNGDAPKFTLYTNHRCPYAHRAHIVLEELGLPYDEVIIDLSKPREPWYLEVNPRGLVPSIKFNDEIITESAIVAQFLADAYPSHLVPATGGIDAALKRARINFFTDTWNSKVNSYWVQISRKDDEEEKEALVKDFLSVLAKEIEPLLKDAAPYFGGSDQLTLADAIVAPHVIRLYALVKHGVLPESLGAGFNALPNFTKWAGAISKHKSVLGIWDEEAVVSGTKFKINQLKSKA